MTAVWVAIAFGSGLICGALWREAFELITRKDEPMRLLRHLRKIPAERALAVALAVALILVGLVGVGVVLNDRGQSRIVECTSRYNQLSGEARDERNTATETAAAAELDYVKRDLTYQRGLLSSLQTGQPVKSLEGVIADRITANQRYLEQLAQLQKVRATKTYPAPDFCEDYQP